MKKKLEILCSYTKLIPLDEAVRAVAPQLKGQHVDDLTRLKNAIRENGILFPVVLDSNSKKLIDGLATIRALISLAREGWEFAGIPAYETTAENSSKAKELVLAGACEYAKLNVDVAKEWLKAMGWKDWQSQLNIAALDRPNKKKEAPREPKKKAEKFRYQLTFSDSENVEFMELIREAKRQELAGSMASILLLAVSKAAAKVEPHKEEAAAQ